MECVSDGRGLACWRRVPGAVRDLACAAELILDDDSQLADEHDDGCRQLYDDEIHDLSSDVKSARSVRMGVCDGLIHITLFQMMLVARK